MDSIQYILMIITLQENFRDVCGRRSSLDLAVRVRALAGDIVLCSWARHFTLTVPLSTQGMFLLRSYFFIIITKTSNKSLS